jgi:hypothetical protein
MNIAVATTTKREEVRYRLNKKDANEIKEHNES